MLRTIAQRALRPRTADPMSPLAPSSVGEHATHCPHHSATLHAVSQRPPRVARTQSQAARWRISPGPQHRRPCCFAAPLLHDARHGLRCTRAASGHSWYLQCHLLLRRNVALGCHHVCWDGNGTDRRSAPLRVSSGSASLSHRPDASAAKQLTKRLRKWMRKRSYKKVSSTVTDNCGPAADSPGTRER